MSGIQVYLVKSLLVIRVQGKAQYHACEGKGAITWEISDKHFGPEGCVLDGPMLFRALEELNKEGL